MEPLSYLHPLDSGSETLPAAFTFPFRYTPHPLCRRAAIVVQEKLKEMGVTEGKMYGVLVGSLNNNGKEHGRETLYFLAAYSGQLDGSYSHPWFVPPIVDYLDPESHFQLEQKEIVALSQQMEELKSSAQRREWQHRVQLLNTEREAAVAQAKRLYEEGKQQREALRAAAKQAGTDSFDEAALIHESQQQKADIQRAKRRHKEETEQLEGQLAALNQTVHELYEQRKRRSEALQQWLFRQFVFLNGRGKRQNLTDIFQSHFIPSGAGECCAPKLLQTAYQLGMKPLAMAEFWWGSSSPSHYREPGAFFPACRSKCHPILGHMLQGLTVEPDPADHYNNKILAPVRVMWEDEDLAVVLKPEGWVSIPGKSDQPCLLDECYRLWPNITGSVIVHRLDQDTSGVMVIAKNQRAHRALSLLFERREVQKRYIALIETERVFPSSRFTITLPLGPDLENMPHRHVDYVHGKEAVTLCEVLGQEEKDGRMVTRMAFYPKTGRTHQLRVHSASVDGLNAPIVGDRLYGQVADRLYLHAETIDFEHPFTHERMHIQAPAPF